MGLYSVGHSNAAIEDFLALLRRQGIAVLVDVRSVPYSRYNPQFTREALQRSVEAAGMQYRFLGDRIGGKPAQQEFLLENGRADYERIAASAPFREGLNRLIDLGASAETAFMCAEADYRHCHRYHLITKALLERGLRVRHLLHTGDLVESAPDEFQPRQPSLFS